MATDPKTGNVVMFGGNSDFGSRLNDTWLWNGAAWVNATHPLGPSARFGHGMAHDPGAGQTVMFGGRDSSSVDLDDTWVWDGAWVKHVVLGAKPSPRRQHAMAYDPTSGGVILFGGNGATNYNDTWLWTGAAWLNVTPANPADSPPPRFLAQMAFDPTLGKLVLFGGLGNSGDLDDTWAWNFALRKWEQLNVSGPSARHGAGFAFDPVFSRLVLFGGSTGGGETWAWQLGAWTQLFPTNAPGDRMTVTATTHVGTGRLVLFGGIGAARYNDTWVYGASADPGDINPGDLVPDPIAPYSSDDCDAGTNVVSGHFGSLGDDPGVYAKLRTAPDPDTGATMVCVAADDGTAHVGGRLSVNGTLPGTPVATDSNDGACAGQSGNVTVLSGTVAGNQPVRLDVAPVPGDDDDLVWVCARATNSVGVRLIFTTAAGSGTGFEPDVTDPHLPYPVEPWPVVGQPSSACDTTTPGSIRNRLVNARVGNAFVGLYFSREAGSTDALLCYRAQTSPTQGTGGKVTVDQSPSVNPRTGIGGAKFPECTWAAVHLVAPVEAGIFTSFDPTAPGDVLPVSACAVIGTNAVSVGFDPEVGGSFEQDTA